MAHGDGTAARILSIHCHRHKNCPIARRSLWSGLKSAPALRGNLSTSSPVATPGTGFDTLLSEHRPPPPERLPDDTPRCTEVVRGKAGPVHRPAIHGLPRALAAHDASDQRADSREL